MTTLKELGYVSVGMVIADLNGNELLVTDIIIPSSNMHVLMSKLPVGKDLIIQLNKEYYLHTDEGWEHLDSRIKVVKLS